MRVKLLTAGLLAVAGLLAGSAGSQAGDVFRLAIPAGDDTPTMKLGEVAPDADTLDVWRGGGFRGGFGGGFRGGFGGFRGGFGGFRGGFGGFRGGFVGFRGGFVRGGFGGFGGQPFFWGGGQPFFWGGGQPFFWNGGLTPFCGDSPGFATTTFSLQLGPTASIQGFPSGSAPYPAPSTPVQPGPNNGTFEYDGGPRSPVPIPRGESSNPPTDPAPRNVQPPVPLEGRAVSIPAPAVRPAPRYTYPAYGELPRASTDSSRQVKR